MLLPPERGAESLGENNPFAVASAVVEDSYVGWWSAASFHGFTTQKPATVFVAVRRQTKTRTIEGTEIRFVKVEPRKFFGDRSVTVQRSVHAGRWCGQRHPGDHQFVERDFAQLPQPARRPPVPPMVCGKRIDRPRHDAADLPDDLSGAFLGAHGRQPRSKPPQFAGVNRSIVRVRCNVLICQRPSCFS